MQLEVKYIIHVFIHFEMYYLQDLQNYMDLELDYPLRFTQPST